MRKIQSEPSLTALLVRAKSGDPTDLMAVYERFLPLIKKLARRFPGDARKDAEQELFIELLQAIGRFRASAVQHPRAPEARKDNQLVRERSKRH